VSKFGLILLESSTILGGLTERRVLLGAVLLRATGPGCTVHRHVQGAERTPGNSASRST